MANKELEKDHFLGFLIVLLFVQILISVILFFTPFVHSLFKCKDKDINNPRDCANAICTNEECVYSSENDKRCKCKYINDKGEEEERWCIVKNEE